MDAEAVISASGFHGWLSWRDIPAEIDGIKFDDRMPTRREEFTIARNVAAILNGRVAFDAGCGHTPNRHVLAYILAKLGYFVIAMDEDEQVLAMPEAPRVLRAVGPMEKCGLPSESIDLITCISVLEHCTIPVFEAFSKEAARITKPGSVIVCTADMTEPEVWPLAFPEFDFGELAPMPEKHLEPPVSFGVGVRK